VDGDERVRGYRKNRTDSWSMNEPPGARARVALSALTVAEYFRDEERQDVLLFVDNIFRFTQAGSEVSAFTRAYSVSGRVSTHTLQKWVSSKNESRQQIKDPLLRFKLFTYLPTTTLIPRRRRPFAHLDATTNLSRQIAELGIYPAVDPLASTSRS